jgi:hypothetical protein
LTPPPCSFTPSSLPCALSSVSPSAFTPQDKIDESEDKEAILGADILNPTTGLSLKDYLEGREQDHNELIARALLGEEAFKDDHTTYLDSEVGALLTLLLYCDARQCSTSQ